MKLALNHQLFLISLSLRGFALLELEVEVSLVDSAVTNGQLLYANHMSQLSGETFSGAAGHISFYWEEKLVGLTFWL